MMSLCLSFSLNLRFGFGVFFGLGGFDWMKGGGLVEEVKFLVLRIL